MIHDDARNERYRAAIRQLVRDKVVVDIGTGQDVVLARMCVEAGARKVYAIEIQEGAYQRAVRRVRRLGLEEKIMVIHGDSAHAKLPEKVDVCVSELIGAIGNSEGAAVILNDARRFLKEDGIMIPERCVTNIAAVQLPDDFVRDPKFTELSAGYVRATFEQLGRPFDLRVSFKNFPAGNLLSTAGIFEDMDFRKPVASEFDREVTLTVTRPGRLDGVLLWLHLYTSPGEVIDSLSQVHNWLPVYFPLFDPGIEVEAGDTIRAVCSARLSEDGMNPDYSVRGTLRRADGECISFDYASPLYETQFQASPFYKRLFSPAGSGPQTLPSRGLSADLLRQHIRQHLPEYMTPSAFVFLDRLPLTPNGKADRRALPAPGAAGPDPARSCVGPRDALEQQLVALWEETLGVSPVGVTDSFFDLGGHSLVAIRLFSRMAQLLGRELPLSILFQAPTVEQLARLLRGEELRSSPLVAIQPDGFRTPFFCIHGAGGNVLCFRSLARHLGPDQPFYGLQSPEPLEDPENPSSIAERAARYLREIRAAQPVGPYFLGGFSFGGRIASEMARQLRTHGEEVGLLALLDAEVPGNLAHELLATPPDAREPRCRSRGQIVLFRAREVAPEYAGAGRLSGTGITAGLTLHEVPGSHETILQEPNVRVLARVLRTCLDQSQAALQRE
jgi:thioesterase domain-containing protein